jgi:hypothetical protein
MVKLSEIQWDDQSLRRALRRRVEWLDRDSLTLLSRVPLKNLDDAFDQGWRTGRHSQAKIEQAIRECGGGRSVPRPPQHC